ncbi:MAG: hypothetical protein EAZ35_02200 [Sphingobacteriia bacterium]|nr:MAG: hypothetical protein EAZ35_02200 [Sphingobacteriia bacterium]
MSKGLVIDLGKRYQNAFGYAPSTMSTGLKRAGFADALKSAEVYIQDTRAAFEELKLLIGATEILHFGYAGFITNNINVFAPPPIVRFSFRKRIVETPVSAGIYEELPEGGVVVEKYNHDPWDISIQGLLIDMDNHTYPGQKIKQIVALAKKDQIIDVQSVIFSDHGVTSIYIKELETTGVVGYPDTWQFSIQASSIKDISFIFKQ